MASMRSAIVVPAPRAEAASAWLSFIDSVLVGRRRLACDELLCVDPADSGIVGFDDLGGGRTRVSVTVPVAEELGAAERDLLERKAGHDLVLFWDYVQSGEHLEAAATSGAAALKDDVRHGRLMPPQRRPDAEPLSVRRSGRA